MTLGRSDLSRLLFEKLNGQIESIFGDTIIVWKRSQISFESSFEHARERRFGLVIGADGLHSRLRSLVFGPQTGYEPTSAMPLWHLKRRGYRPREEDIYCMYGQPGRMLGRFTLRDNRILFLFVFVATEQMPGTLDEQKVLLRDLYRHGGWECTKALYEVTELMSFISTLSAKSGCRIGRVAALLWWAMLHSVSTLLGGQQWR